jgi:hypothetical protein
MHRLFRSFSLVLLAAALGASTGVAQPSSSMGAIEAQTAGVADQEDVSVAVDRGDRAEKAISHAEVERVMLGGMERKSSELPVDLRRTNSKPLQQEAGSNRTVYYIIGGALVAGGLVAGILALDDGGGGGGDDLIPPPPTRP